MFKRNINYNERSYGRDTEITGKDVVLYPENRLEPIVVKSDFGDCLVLTSDLYDLFNQQRISNFGADVVRDFISRNYPISSALSDKISNMSDDEILMSIKPRNIQSYSELMAWSKYMQNEIDNALSSTTEPVDPVTDPVVDPSAATATSAVSSD